MSESDFIPSQIKVLIKNYPSLKNEQDYHIFTLLCLKYFYFSDPGTSFDPKLIIQDYITDGKDDGGIDAVFNDPTSESNDVIIVQSKYYDSSSLKGEEVAAELIKIATTLRDMNNRKFQGYNPSVVTAYQNSLNAKADDGEVKIVFFTSFKPRTIRSRNKIEKIVRENFKDYTVELVFREDIEDQIKLIENGHKYVDHDQLEIDCENNCLRYNDSIIVNISAKSLQELFARRRNGLLGMNLRYYVKRKDVDIGIERSIRQTPENFWYKNNGVLIVCDEWNIEGNVLKLTNFSIINGGQTTNRIGCADICKDFYLQCKVVKAKGADSTEKEDFILGIAEATNSQKRIDDADLKANTPEQLSLKERLSHRNVYYVLKKGDKPPKQLKPYEFANVNKIGKVALAGVLQMPGSARSNPKRMFQKEYYNQIFGKDANATVLADLLKLEFYYELFLKTELKDRGFDKNTVIPVLKYGTTFVLACICFLCKVNSSVFDYDAIANLINKPEELKLEIRKMSGLDRLIQHRVDNEKELIFSIYSFIGEDVLGFCFEAALEKANEDLSPANYLKVDINYHKDVLKRLWSQYKKNSKLSTAIDTIFKK